MTPEPVARLSARGPAASPCRRMPRLRYATLAGADLNSANLSCISAQRRRRSTRRTTCLGWQWVREPVAHRLTHYKGEGATMRTIAVAVAVLLCAVPVAAQPTEPDHDRPRVTVGVST